VPSDEGGIVDAKGWIEQRTGVDEIEETLLLGAHGPWVFFEALEEAESFVFIVELVCDCGDGGSAEKIYGFVEAGFESAFDMVSQGDALFAGGDFG